MEFKDNPKKYLREKIKYQGRLALHHTVNFNDKSMSASDRIWYLGYAVVHYKKYFYAKNDYKAIIEFYKTYKNDWEYDKMNNMVNDYEKM